MPNWVHNCLEVKGDPKILDKIEKDFQKEDWHWTDYFPVPKELENIGKEHWKELDQMVSLDRDWETIMYPIRHQLHS